MYTCSDDVTPYESCPLSTSIALCCDDTTPDCNLPPKEVSQCNYSLEAVPIILRSFSEARGHPVGACDQIDQLAKNLIASLTVSLARSVKARSQKENLLPP